MSRTILLSILTILFLATISIAAEPDDLEKALTAAKTNRAELEKAISYFQKKGDSDQLEAIQFLIRNMAGHCYVEVALYDTLKKEIPFDILSYKNIDSAQKALQSIEKERGPIDFDRKQKVVDLETITSDYLIETVELSFLAWHTRPWAKSLTKSDFFEYVLPYRGSNEPIEPWRKFFIDRYATLAATMKDSTDPIEAATLINRELMKWFTFDSRYYLHPTDLGLAEMRKTHLGRCEDMTNLTIYALRANGIAVVSDYTPYWANSGNNHAWNAVLDKAGIAIPFMGCEADPRSYQLSGKIGKAYRKMYSKQTNTLSSKQEKWEKAPGWLAGNAFIDVTTAYANVSDISLPVTRPIPDSTRFAYLCVFNSGQWKPIQWSMIDNKATKYMAMGRGVAYVPMFLVNDSLIAAGDAFILKPDGTRQVLAGDTTKTQSIQVLSTTKRVYREATEGKVVVSLDSNAVYELQYWNDGWKKLGEQTYTGMNVPLEFKNVPCSRFYWIVKKDSDKEEERIFTIEGGKQVWW